MVKKYCFIFLITVFLLGATTVYGDEWYDSYFQIYDIELSENFSDYVLIAEEFADLFELNDTEQADAKENITLKKAAEIICNILPSHMLYYSDPVENLNALGIIVGDENGINPDSCVTYAQALIIKERVNEALDHQAENMKIMYPYGNRCNDGNNGGYVSDYGHNGVYHFNSDGDMELISNDKWASFLNYCDGELTYINVNEVKTLDINSGESVVHDNSVFSAVYRNDNDIYYIKNGLIHCDAITNEKTVINSQVDGSFYIIYNYVYYIIDYKLYRSTLDGSISEYICDVYSDVMDTKDNKIYFVDEHCNLSSVDFALNSYEIVRENKKTKNGAYEWYISAMCINDDFVFLSENSISSCEIYKLNISSGEVEYIDSGYMWFSVCSDKLIYDFWYYDESGKYVHEISMNPLSEL